MSRGNVTAWGTRRKGFDAAPPYWPRKERTDRSGEIGEDNHERHDRRRCVRLFAAVMATPRRAESVAVAAKSRRFCSGAAVFAAAVFVAAIPAQAQQPQLPPERGVIVIGEGSVSAPPDYARITSGVTTRAKTAKEAGDADAKVMAGILAALQIPGRAKGYPDLAIFRSAGLQSRPANIEQRLTGFSVSNQVAITIRQIDKVGEILDRLVTAGATDVGHVEFLHSDPSKRSTGARGRDRRCAAQSRILCARFRPDPWRRRLDHGRFALRRALPMTALRASAAKVSVPIAAGEDTLHVRITVGYDMTH